MLKRICDFCGSEEGKELWVDTGNWTSDPAGGRSTQDQDAHDICYICLSRLALIIISRHKLSPELNELLRERKKRNAI